MTAMTRNQLSYRYILASQYFLYFGILGIFLPYFNLYCYHLGFSGFQIGSLSGVRSMTTVLFPLVWGILADRYQIRKPIYVACCFISSAVWVFYLCTVDFWLMLMITISYGIFYAPIISFLEAFSMDLLGDEKKKYGRIRAWGSVSFIGTVVVLGRLIDFYSIEIILVIALIGSLLQALVSTGIPGITLAYRSIKPGTHLLGQKRVRIFLVCAFLMLVSHGTYYGFFSIHLENMGYGHTFIGLSWALASIAEILVMLRSDNIFRRFSLESVLLASFTVAVLRWCVLFFARSAVVILLSQILHAATYGAFHMASILYMDRMTPNEDKTFGQAVNNAVTYGLGMMVGFFLNGYFYEMIGSFTLFLLSALVALGGGLLFGIVQMPDRGAEGTPRHD
jgi:PPP family 3-phenylpropionic acid transporter